MAEDKNSDKKFDITSAISGMNSDNTLNQIEKGKVTYALNAVVETFSGTSINYQNEHGNVFCIEFPKGYSLVGNTFVPERKLHIFMLAGENDSIIGTMDEGVCEFKPLTRSSCLGFSINHPIQKILHRIERGELEIYWTDNIARRYLNIDDIPKKINENSDLCDPDFIDEIDCNRIKVQPVFDIPVIEISRVTGGGTLKWGTYQFAVQYSDALGNGFTSYYSVTNPLPLMDPLQISVNFDNEINRSIHLRISNLDTSGLYQHFNLAVIKTVNNISSVELVGTFYIDNRVKSLTYTGQQTDNIRLSIDDIFKRFPLYEKAKDLTIIQDVIVWNQLSSFERVNYQKIANKIQLDWVMYRIPPGENYADEINASSLVSCMRDEVYPYEIVFITGDGKESDRFHIPGREKTFQELSQEDILPENNDYIGDGEPVPYWKVYNTAFFKGFYPGYTTDNNYKGPYMYGAFGYHESSEEYPCDVEIWGELAGKKIRHHKFPDVSVAPIYESKTFTGKDNMEMGENAIFSLGVKLDPGQISFLLESSDLTREQKDNIVGYKILRGDRTTNKSVIAKGLLRNVGKYEREGQEYYFPNYPYNDVSEDKFLNATNNAFEAVCQPFDIKITKNENVEIEYSDCNTNKQLRTNFQGPGDFNICSTTKPIAVSGQAEISYATYEIWTVRPTGLQGVRVEWDDITVGVRNRWFSGGIYQGTISGAPENINVRSGTVPVRISGAENPLIYRNSYVFSDFECGTASSVDNYKEEDNMYRQVFNSPDTSFTNTTLGNILKLESVMFGKGKAHFVEVRDNAKYKLLTKEAQLDILKSAGDLGNITDPFNAQAFFAAFEAYTTTYLNNMTRRNYAYSFNSIASYNYYRTVPDNKGVKQRMLDISRYLIPGVQNVGDDININNYQRETSVFLKTDENKSPIPFPHESPNMISGGQSIVTDKSRFTISEKGNCGVPGKEEDINVVGYYASIKNNIANQWGQIYSYDIVDTGYYNTLDGTKDLVFGGDTFIGRFAFKTKLPFFIDNRVGAPDDSDIFYDEIGNVAYPKYWHSSRSILESRTVPNAGTFTNIISYKAHNFDCPNSQGGEDETEAPGRTYYDGIYYLFAYGIPYFYCESSINIDLRQAVNNKEGDFFPRVSTGIPDDWLQERNVSIQNDNSYIYNVSFSKQNKESFYSFLPFDWQKRRYDSEYPFRAIFSEKRSQDTVDSRVNNWLIYKPLSYFDFPQNFGRLISLEGMADRQILARFENRSQIYNAMVTADTSTGKLFLGQSIFDGNVPPLDFGESDLGYMGTQHVFFIKTPYGYVSVDAQRGQVFIISGNKATDISGKRMERFFKENLPFKILEHFPEINIDNNFKDIGLHGVYDKTYSRLILTKLDYIPLENVKYDGSEFYIEKVYGDITVKETVSVNDIRYFCNRSWTISFNFKTNGWISFHSYLPNWYINEVNRFYSGLNNCCEEFDFIAVETYHDPNVITTTTTTLPTTSTTTTRSPGISTTTSTTTSIDCSFDAEIFEMECEVGEITINVLVDSPILPCSRPLYLEQRVFITGYTLLSNNQEFITTGTLEEACSLAKYIGTVQEGEISLSLIQFQSASLFQGEDVYAENNSLDCERIPDGYYITDESMDTGTVYHVVGGKIISLLSCQDVLKLEWEINESLGLGSPDYVDANMRIFINDIQVIEEFGNNSGTLNLLTGSIVRIQYFHLGSTFPLGEDVVDPRLQLIINGINVDDINLIVDEDASENYIFTLTEDTEVFVRGIDPTLVSTTTTTTTSP